MHAPEKAAAQAELLTRDADAPEEASGESAAPPPPSKLAAQTLMATTASNGAAAVNGVASKLAAVNLKARASAGVRAAGVAPAATARAAAV